MEKIILDERWEEEYEYILPTLHVESDLYVKDSFLIKILHNYLLDSVRINTINKLDEMSNESVALSICTVETFNHDFGYMMQYYKNYKMLSYILNNKYLSLKERRSIIHKLSKAFNYFEEIGFIYTDVHSENILFKSGEIKIIDLDSGYFENDIHSKYDIEKDKQMVLNNISSLYFSILFNIDFSPLKLKGGKKINLYENASKELLKLLNNIYNTNSNLNDPEYLVNNITDDEVLRLRKVFF